MQKTRCAQVGPAEESAGGGGAIAEHVFSIAEFDVMNNGIAPEQAIDNAFKRAEAIFAKYQIVQG